MVGSWGTLRNDHSEIFASPGLIAVSVKIGNCSPESPAASTFCWRIPKRGSATLEQVGPMATSQSSLASFRTTEMPSSALHRSSTKVVTILARVPSARRMPPALLISSTAMSNTALELIPKPRMTPLMAPTPAILIARSWASAPLAGSHASAEAKVVRARRNSGMRARGFIRAPPLARACTAGPAGTSRGGDCSRPCGDGIIVEKTRGGNGDLRRPETLEGAGILLL